MGLEVENMYRVFKIHRFEKSAQKLFTSSELLEVQRLVRDLKEGAVIGKPLSYPFFREKKICGKRVYFLVYEDFKIVFLVNASDKGHQQKTIDEIKALLPHFKKEAERIFNTQ